MQGRDGNAPHDDVATGTSRWSEALAFMDGRANWDETPDGSWVCHWGFRGRAYPQGAPLADLSVRILRARRADGGAVGVAVDVTTNGVVDGCARHTPVLHSFWFPDPALPALLDGLEQQALSIDLGDVALCVLFGACSEHITWIDQVRLRRERSAYVRSIGDQQHVPRT